MSVCSPTLILCFLHVRLRIHNTCFMLCVPRMFLARLHVVFGVCWCEDVSTYGRRSGFYGSNTTTGCCLCLVFLPSNISSNAVLLAGLVEDASVCSPTAGLNSIPSRTFVGVILVCVYRCDAGWDCLDVAGASAPPACFDRIGLVEIRFQKHVLQISGSIPVSKSRRLRLRRLFALCRRTWA